MKGIILCNYVLFKGLKAHQNMTQDNSRLIMKIVEDTNNVIKVVIHKNDSDSTGIQ